MGRKAAKPPVEDPEIKRQRDRSILDLSKLDEEENRRIKQLRSASSGVRAFRAMRSGSGIGSVLPSSGGVGETQTYGSAAAVSSAVDRFGGHYGTARRG